MGTTAPLDEDVSPTKGVNEPSSEQEAYDTPEPAVPSNGTPAPEPSSVEPAAEEQPKAPEGNATEVVVAQEPATNADEGDALGAVESKQDAAQVQPEAIAAEEQEAADIAKATVAKIANQAYTGQAIKPSPKVTMGNNTLKAGTDYTLAYQNNTQAGTATIVVTGKGSYRGTKKATFKIVRPSVNYYVHRQTYGWERAYSKKDGDQSGTTGKSKRLEGIYIKLTNKPVSGSILYRTHIQSYGWEKSWKKDGQMSGTTGKAKRLEAIQIKLSGEMAKKYDVYYRVHAQKIGWMGWAKNGASAGTAGFSYRLESIQIVVVPKGGSAPATNLKGAAQNSPTPFEQCSGSSSTNLSYAATENGEKLTVNIATKRTWTVVKERYGYKNGVINLSMSNMSFYDDHHLVKPKGVGTGWVDAKYSLSIFNRPLRLTYDVTRTLASEKERARTGCKYKYTRRCANYKMQLLYKGGKLIGYRWALASSPNIKADGSDAYYPEPYYSNHKFSAKQMCTVFGPPDFEADGAYQTAADKAYAKNYTGQARTDSKYAKDIYYIANGSVWTLANPHRRMN